MKKLIMIFLFFTPSICLGADAFEVIDRQIKTVNGLIDKGTYQSINEAKFENEIARSYVNKWVEYQMNQTEKIDPSAPLGIEAIKTLTSMVISIRKQYYEDICRNELRMSDWYIYYSNIEYSKADYIEKAKYHYKNIIRNFDAADFKNCFKEAELGLQELIHKEN